MVEAEIEVQVQSGDRWHVHQSFPPDRSMIAIHKAKSLEGKGVGGNVRVVKALYDGNGSLRREEILYHDRKASGMPLPEPAGRQEGAWYDDYDPDAEQEGASGSRLWIWLLLVTAVVAGILGYMAWRGDLKVGSLREMFSLVPRSIEVIPMDTSMLVLNAAKIRAQPSAKSQVVGVLVVGSMAKVTGKVVIQGLTWYRVARRSGEDGFVPAKAISGR